jgi:RND family efflux transporter MFP subunit
MRIKTQILLVALAAAALMAGVAYSYRQRSAIGTPPSSAQREPGNAPAVPVVRVVRADLADTLSLSGEFRPFQEVNVYAKVSGYVKQMKVDVGDRVKAGQVLAVLEIPELQDELLRATASVEKARQEVERAKAAYDEAHLTYTRLAEVIEQQPNLVAQQEVDLARARDQAGRANWVAAQSAVREAQASRARYDTMIAYSTITAPFAGVITKRYSDTGALVGAGTASSTQVLVRLSQLDPLRLVLPVPASAVPKVREGAAVQIAVQATGEVLSGTVSRTSGEVSTTTRTMHVEVDVPNADSHLAPGMYVTATLTQEVRKGALAIPVDTAPNRKDGAATLYVVDAQQRLGERRVTFGLETATQLEVTSGLAENDMVVSGRGQFQAGQLVVPKLVAQRDGQ